MKLSVIIPAYNERDTILTVIEQVRRLPIDTELIVVDDGSTDGTQEVLAAAAASADPAFKVLFQDRNRGKGAAIRRGLRAVTGDAVVIQDADMEYDPGDLIRLLEPIEKGDAAVVYGSRILGRNPRSSWGFYLGGRLLSLLTNLLYGSRITDEPTCYKMFRKDVLDRIPLDCKGFEFCPEVTAKVLRLGYGIVEVPISYRPRTLAGGKKIRLSDGAVAVKTLMRYRFWRPRA